VQQFLKVFVDIVLWRRGPQDLPCSMLLVAATLAAYMLVSVLQLAFMHESGTGLPRVPRPRSAAADGLDLGRAQVYGRVERYPQTIAAILGTSALLALVLSLPIAAPGRRRCCADGESGRTDTRAGADSRVPARVRTHRQAGHRTRTCSPASA
jgi:hypothetical protein